LIQATGASNAMFYLDDKASPAVMIGKSESPQNAMKNVEPYPDLQRWSDIAFLDYYAWAQGNGWSTPNPQDSSKPLVPPPKYFIRPNILTSVTQNVISTVQARSGGFDPGSFPGMRIPPGDDRHKVLLTTPHGFGVSFFLIQHKAVLGDKTVLDINMFGENHPFNLVLEVGDPPA